ncbi:MAG: DUF349 domain-containing protein, partial [Erysipelotrichaceae bacterium]|nr:DUF349 domain-containing protein [Erysipelotrichaceae bacterium]
MENKKDIREELVSKLEELMGEEDAGSAFLRAKELKRRWPRVREEEESFYESEMSAKFNQMLDELSSKAGNVYVNTEERKAEIIQKAKDIVNRNSFKKGTDEMKQLLEEWKHAGRINKERDDELWNEFNAVRNEFFEKKNEYYEKLKESFEANKTLKEELIAKAKEIANIE